MSKNKEIISMLISKIIGEINPVGETNEDNKRYDNLKDILQLIDELLIKVSDVAHYYQYRQEYSMGRAGKTAYKYLKELKSYLEEQIGNE